MWSVQRNLRFAATWRCSDSFCDYDVLGCQGSDRISLFLLLVDSLPSKHCELWVRPYEHSGVSMLQCYGMDRMSLKKNANWASSMGLWASKLDFQGLQVSELKGLGPLRLEAWEDFHVRKSRNCPLSRFCPLHRVQEECAYNEYVCLEPRSQEIVQAIQGCHSKVNSQHPIILPMCNNWMERTKDQNLSAPKSRHSLRLRRFSPLPRKMGIFKAPRCAISLQSKIAIERRFSLRWKRTKLTPTAELAAIPEPAVKNR